MMSTVSGGFASKHTPLAEDRNMWFSLGNNNIKVSD